MSHEAAAEIKRLHIRIRQDAEAALSHLNEIDVLREENKFLRHLTTRAGAAQLERDRWQHDALGWSDRLTEATDEIERLRADKDVQRSQARNAAYEADIERLRAAQDVLQTEINRMGGGLLVQHADIERLREQVASLQASSGYEASIAQVEIERLRAAIRWAMGEAPNAEGKWFDDAKPHPYPKYWWRTELRRALEPKP